MLSFYENNKGCNSPFNFNLIITYTMETVTVELSWEEYRTMMSALEAMKQMVDSQKLEDVYIKLYMKRKVEKG